VGSAAPSGSSPRAGRDYPANFTQFVEWFHGEADAWSYIARLRWPDGFSCPACGNADAWLTDRYLYVCTSCRRQTSVTAGTVFDRSRLSLRQWLYALWLVAGEKRGVSAKSLQNSLGLGSYETAWLALHKIRLAMTKTSPDLLSGVVEVDESYIGGVSAGKRGRGTDKAIIAIAVERLGYGKKSKRVKLGRVRMRVIPNTQRRTLEDFITDVVEQGARVHTDGKKQYDRVEQLGYTHQVTNQSTTNDPAHVSMPGVHRVASLVKRWVLGTHQGGLARQHLEAYLDEFTFRFNRRASRSRGLVFYRLLEQCLRTRPLSRETIVLSRRGQRGKVRGPAPKRRRQKRTQTKPQP
jgi:transposase-like protein